MSLTDSLIVALMAIGVLSLITDIVVHAGLVKRMDALKARHDRICKQLGINTRKDDNI